MKRLLVYLLLTSLTTACGWHLRGSTGGGPSLEHLYVSSDNHHGPFITQFLQSLRANNITVADDPKLAPVQLFISNEAQERRTAAVGSDALTSAFELVLSVDYTIVTPEGQPLTALNTARVIRTFDYSARSATSGAREESLLLTEMRRELAQLLIRRVEAVAQRLDPAPIDNEQNGQTAP
jgi:LPS-assembly lipoprotein